MHHSEKYLSVHVETTGLNYDLEKSICDGYNVVVVSFVVCDSNFKVIDDITVHFNQDAEDYGQNYHGITPAILEECGVDEEEGVVELSSFILDHFDGSDYIVCMGQNVHSFTLPFLKQLFYRNEIYFKFSSNSLEVFSITTPTLGPYTIKELLETFGDVDELDVDDEENVKYLSLMKAITFVATFRKISKLWKKLTESYKP